SVWNRLIRASVQRKGLLHFLARVVIGVKRDLRCRAHALTGLLIVAEAIWRGRIGNRKIKSVTGPHADGTECPTHRLLRGGENAAAIVASEQPIEETSLLAGNCRRTILRPASVITESDQQGLSLCGAFRVSPMERLKLIAHPIKPEPLLVNLSSKRAALRRRVTEKGEEAGAVAPDPPRLRHQPVDLKLLAIDHVFRAPNLVGAGGVCITLVNRRQLRLEPLACRVRRLGVGRGQSQTNRQRR